jgi:magnesium transporter
MALPALKTTTYDEVLAAIATRSWEDLRGLLRALHPSDIADLIIDLPSAEEAVVFRLLPRDLAAQVFSYLPRRHQEELFKSLTSEELTRVLNDVRPDDRTRLFEALPAAVTRELLGYPPNSAGRYMTPKYATIRPEMTAAEALAHIHRTGRNVETLNVVYIVDETGRLIEDVRLGSLVIADPVIRVTDIADPALVAIQATDSRATVIAAFEKYDRVALPVVDAQRQMLGIITADDVLDLVARETTEDIQKIGGSEALDQPYSSVSFWSMFKKRGGWLSALFLGEMLTATAMGYFEGEIQKAVVLALFVPLIISSGGNSGSQATSIIIRSLALGELRLNEWFRVFRREVLSGLSLGMLLGFIGFLRIVAWQHLHLKDYGIHYMLVAFTVWASLVGVVSFGSLAGSMLPFLLRRLGFDPATSSAPFVATLVDVTGLIIYFTVAMLILRGTLL